MATDLLEVAKTLARQAIPIATSFQSPDLEVQEKVEDGRASPVTLADQALHDHFVAGLASTGIHVLSEEDADDKSRLEEERVWIVDPLDGTKEFIAGREEYTINVALVENGKPVLGVIALPARDQLYWAKKGEGAFLDGERLAVSMTDSLPEATLVHSRSHVSDDLKVYIKQAGITKTTGSGSSVKGCLVASGEADLYPRLGRLMEWDVAAMQCILEEAGGAMTALDGSPITYNKDVPEVLGFLASNTRLHNAFLEVLDGSA